MPPSHSSSSGRFTAVILCLVIVICVAMIGGASYMKYRMDRAESMLVASMGAPEDGQADNLEHLRDLLGYGGFLGSAQKYADTHDQGDLATMRQNIQEADKLVSQLPEQKNAHQQEIIAIAALFDDQLQRLAAVPTSSIDPASLAVMLPVLDTQIAAVNVAGHSQAQQQLQFWGMLLTLVSWCSLVIASACAAGIYLALRDKHAAPLRALAQSIQNMSRGDMRTSIWGIERQDMVGELARAVDIARYHFSHLPDLSLLSEQGPVRLRFEGGSRSLFEAMMKAISGDSEIIRTHASALTDAVQHQKESIGQIAEKIQSVLEGILRHGQDGDTQLRKAIHDMVHSTESLKNAHAHAADQLGRLIPSLQDRAAGLVEIAQITGKQASQSLQALSQSDLGLRANAEQVKETLDRLSATADDLGERLFGAINLLQASGKVLAETTETIRGRVSETGSPFTTAPVFDPLEALSPFADKIDQLKVQMRDMQNMFGSHFSAAPVPQPALDMAALQQYMHSLERKLDVLLEKTSVQTAGSPASAFAEQADELRRVILNEINLRISNLDRHMLQQSQTLIDQLAAASLQTREEITRLTQASQIAVPAHDDTIFADQLRQDMARLTAKLAAAEPVAPAAVDVSTHEIKQQVKDCWLQIAAQIEASRSSLAQDLSARIADIELKLHTQIPASSAAANTNTQHQIEQQTSILTELVATLAALDSHMQEIQSEMRTVSARAR